MSYPVSRRLLPVYQLMIVQLLQGIGPYFQPGGNAAFRKTLPYNERIGLGKNGVQEQRQAEDQELMSDFWMSDV